MPYVPVSGCSGQVSCGPFYLPQCVRAPLVELLGYASAALLSPTRCTLAVGEPIPFMDSSTSVWLLSHHESFEYFLRFFRRACGVCAFLASSVSHGVVTPPFLPALTVYYHEVPLLVFRLMWYLVRCFCSVLRYLRGRFQCRFLCLPCTGLPMWRLFPQFRGFRTSFGDFCSCLRNFGASASIPWLRLWCGLFFGSVCLSSACLYPVVAGLVGFSCGPPSLVVPVCVCVGFFWAGRAVSSFLLLGVG